MKRWSNFTARIVAWGLLFLLTGAVIAQVVMPTVQAYTTARSNLALKKELISKLFLQNAELRQVQGEIGALSDHLRQEGFLLGSIDPGQAGAEIRDYFAEAVRSSGGTVQSTQNLSLRPDGALQGSALRISMTATLEQLYALLHHLESQRPFLFIDTLSLQAQVAGRQVASSGSQLRIQMSVVGYVLEDAS